VCNFHETQHNSARVESWALCRASQTIAVRRWREWCDTSVVVLNGCCFLWHVPHTSAAFAAANEKACANGLPVNQQMA